MIRRKTVLEVNRKIWKKSRKMLIKRPSASVVTFLKRKFINISFRKDKRGLIFSSYHIASQIVF